jgi:hypothetical protein
MPLYLRPHDHGGGRWEGEDLVDAATATSGKVEEAGMEFWGDLFSGQYGLLWDEAKTNAVLTLPFTVEKAGRYNIIARLSRAEAGGTFKLQVDDLKSTDPINLYQPSPIPGLFETATSEANLVAGPHTLKFVSQPPDERAKGKRLLLDKFQVREVKE